MRKTLIGQEMHRLRWKSLVWEKYMKGKISYWMFKDESWKIAVRIRKAIGETYLSLEKFNEAWQYMIVGHENYRKAYSEFVRVIMLDY